MMKSKALSLVLILLFVLALIWIVGPTVSLAHQGAPDPAAQGIDLHAILLARATPTRSVTPTPLPAAYQVEQKHPAMIAGAGVLVLIILAGVLAFSRHKA